MYWILAALLLLVTLAVPRLRPVSIAGLMILAALLAWGVVQRMRGPAPESPTLPQRGQPTSPAAPLTAVPLTAVGMEAMQLSGGGAPFELRGRIVNRAPDLQLKSVTIRITRRDCYEGALDPSGCVVLWQDRHWMPLVVPPLQARDFADSIWMRGSAPRPRGQIQDSFELVAAMGETASADKPRG
ncbi:MAG TPA: hypothetical protein VHK24_12910 [Steroidobacter sp.]|nr:hypothetical protein [Steroidobacter sp.]